MAWSFRIGRIAGIDLKLHVTFAVILALGAAQWAQTHGARGAAFGALLVCLLFACVVLHELGHALMARRFGITTHAIVLLPIGGIAQLAHSPRQPQHELWISVAGPAVNLVISAVLLLTAFLTGLAGLPEESVRALLSQPSAAALLLWLLGANVTMALFNLLPALPMDGGRILRAVLAMRLDPARATLLAATVAQVLAVAMGALAIAGGHFMLAVIAGFVLLGAGQERSAAHAQQRLAHLSVGDAYHRHAVTLAPGDRVWRVVDHLLARPQEEFAVLLGGQLLGVVTRRQVLETLRNEGAVGYVAGLMLRDVPRFEESTSLQEAYRRMGELRTPVSAVYRGEEFLGLLGLASISEVLRADSATAPPAASRDGLRRAAEMED
ncbi:MAG TPA: site-2 protease family protein [Myxococcaceae bacterium]|jgi:Zn-dependent protease